MKVSILMSESEEDDFSLVLVQPSQIRDPEIIEQIQKDSKQSYYVVKDFSPETYALLAFHGFMSVTHGSYLLPEMQRKYCVLRFENLHVSKKTVKMAKRGGYTLTIDTDFESVLRGIRTAHGERNWLTER